MKTLLALTALVAGTFLARDLVSPAADASTLTFYGDGTLKSSTVYVDGVRNGPTEQYYSDGSPQWRGAYADGEREGEWIFWTPGGEVDPERSGRYRDGIKVE